MLLFLRCAMRVPQCRTALRPERVALRSRCDLLRPYGLQYSSGAAAARAGELERGVGPAPTKRAEPQCFEVGADLDGMRLTRWFLEKFPGIPMSRCMEAMRKGFVKVMENEGTVFSKKEDGYRLKPSYKILLPPVVFERPTVFITKAKRSSSSSSSSISSTLSSTESFSGLSKKNESKRALLEQQIQSRKAQEWIRSLIVFEDEAMMAINKPPGLISAQGGSSLQSVERALQLGWGGERWLVHRLDKDTSGVLLIAKSRRVATFLHNEFAQRRVTKTYWALVSPAPQMHEGRIKAPLRLGLLKSEVASAPAAETESDDA